MLDFLQGLLGTIPGAACQGLIWGILAIGVFITFKIQDIADLTVDGSVCTGAAVCAVMIINGVHPVIAMLCAFVAGALTGIVTGLLHVLLGIPVILSGILVQMMLWSVNLKILGKANISLSSRTYDVVVSQGSIKESPQTLIVLAIITAAVIALLCLFLATEIGFSIRSTGSNENMSKAQGINTSLMKVIGLALSNALVAFAGAILAQYQGYVSIDMGRGAIVIGLAAVVIGTALIGKAGRFFWLKFLFVSLGAVIYYIIYQVIIYSGFDTNLLKMLSAIVVAIFLGIPYLKNRIMRFKNVKEEPRC